MRLHSPKFEKALRKSVRRAVRSSPELKREFRRAKYFHRNSQLGRILRPLIALLLGFVVWGAASATGHVATGLAIINLCSSNHCPSLDHQGFAPAVIHRLSISGAYFSSILGFGAGRGSNGNLSHAPTQATRTHGDRGNHPVGKILGTAPVAATRLVGKTALALV